MISCRLRLIFLLVLLCSPYLYADVIYLKNGKQIECDSTLEEGTLLKYKITHGTISIPRSMVLRIEKSKQKPQVAAEVNTEQAHTQALTTEQLSSQDVAEIKNKLQTDPSTQSQLASLYTGMGLSAIDKKDFAGAMENFQKAYDLEKTTTTTMNLALICFFMKDDWNAERYFQELLKMNPKDHVVMNYLGEIAWRNEDLTAAQSYWQQSLELKRTPEIQAKLARLKKEKQASDSYEGSTSPHFLLKYDGGTADPNLVREISEYLEEAYSRLSNQFEFYPASPFLVILYPQKVFFNITDAPFWSSGVNDGKIKLPVRGLTSITDELKTVLVHELTHSFVDNKTGGNCPRWLQEGLAQYVEGNQIDDERLKALSVFLKRNPTLRMNNLSGSFNDAPAETAAILYLVSQSFTDYLINRHQFYQMNALLENLGNGVAFSKAIEDTYLLPLSELEQQWHTSLDNL